MTVLLAILGKIAIFVSLHAIPGRNQRINLVLNQFHSAMRLRTAFFAFLVSLSGIVSAQLRDTTFVDDPVAAMLDSLARNKYIASLPKVATPRNNKFGFAPDSVPRYDASVIEARLAKLDNQSPFDMVYNTDVKAYIDMYTLRKRGSVERMLGISQLYYPIFEEKLDKYNLPLELKHLAVIESALNPTATSRSGARGLWQFMYPTGKMFGLEVTSYIDERCDPYQATEAACLYLQYLYGLFGDWQMVLAAYNSGPGTVNKAIRRAGGGKKTYWEIRPFLPKETQGYVPAFIGAAYAMTFAAEHNLYASVNVKKTVADVDTVNIKQQVSFDQIAAVLHVSKDELQFLNPMYKLAVIPQSNTGEPYTLVLPAREAGNFVANEKAIYDYLKKDTTAQVAFQQQAKIHTVKSGEHINTIARRYKCTVADIRSWNNLKSNYLKPGQKLTVYTPVKTEAKPVVAAATTPATTKPVEKTAQTNSVTPANNNTATASAKKTTSYTVQKGDTLWKISQRTGFTVDEIKKANGFGTKYSLMPGQKIKLPGKA